MIRNAVGQQSEKNIMLSMGFEHTPSGFLAYNTGNVNEPRRARGCRFEPHREHNGFIPEYCHTTFLITYVVHIWKYVVKPSF